MERRQLKSLTISSTAHKGPTATGAHEPTGVHGEAALVFGRINTVTFGCVNNARLSLAD